MGNANEGERDPNAKNNRFACGSNRQSNKHAKTKTRRKMTESVVLEEYGQMVAEGVQRQKIHEQEEIMNNIRGNYIDRLGFSRDRDQLVETAKGGGASKYTNRLSMDTYNVDTSATSSQRSTVNLTVVKDMGSPKEIQRMEMQLNQKDTEQHPGGSRTSRRQSSNVQGWLNHQSTMTPSNASSTVNANRFTVPLKHSKTPRMTKSGEIDGPCSNQPQKMSYVSLGKESADQKDCQLKFMDEEEEKKRATSTTRIESDEELFKHLSYLSQLGQDVEKHQQIDEAGPGEYKLKVLDSSAASPASVKAEHENDPRLSSKVSATPFTLEGFTQADQEELKQGAVSSKRSGSRISRHLQRAGSSVRPLTITQHNSNEVFEPNLGDSHNSNPLTPTQPRSGSVGQNFVGSRGMRRIGTETKPGQRSASNNLRPSSRSNQQIRTQLMSRLAYDKIWLRPQDKPKQSQTCIIFDWDDTILCTTFLQPYHQMIFEPNFKFPPTLQKKLSELDDVADDLLIKAKQFGRVYIVTNAAQGWVELSANRFLPKVFQTLQRDVTIISARTRYEKLYPKNYQKWKVQAFLETRADMEDDAITNLIALGDNIFEIEAAYILGNQFKSAFIKTVKFRQSPSTSELIKQIKLVLTQFDLICNQPKNLTVRLLKQSRQDGGNGADPQNQNQSSKNRNPNGLDSGTAASSAMMSQLHQQKGTKSNLAGSRRQAAAADAASVRKTAGS